MPERKYPIAEIFTSIQGEGFHAGTPMTFVRLAGCNVGKSGACIHDREDVVMSPNDLDAVRTGLHTICTSALGTKFVCDTNYHVQSYVTVSEIRSKITTEHVCITGGEPFLHPLDELVDALGDFARIHIETSGTHPISADIAYTAWITCSPKKGYIIQNSPLVAEFKFVVQHEHELHLVEEWLTAHDVSALTPAFVQPIQSIADANPLIATRFARALVDNFPRLRLSMQLHKYLRMP